MDEMNSPELRSLERALRDVRLEPGDWQDSRWEKGQALLSSKFDSRSWQRPRVIQVGPMARPLHTLFRPTIFAIIAIVATIAVIQLHGSRDASGTQTYATNPGQRAKIKLADGSSVMLAPATRLTVTDRGVDLDGEAMFTVSGDKHSPFIVNTANSQTRVLGTVFTVRKYRTDNATTVAVAEGKVSVHDAVLTNGDIAIAEGVGMVKTTHDAERVAQAMGWAQGRLVMDGIPLSRAIDEVARWYGVDMRMSSHDIGSRTVILTLKDESPEQAFALLADITNTRYTRMGGSVTFSSR